ncbi:13593_t:CDS:10 [Ambispora gerdemannii]|uniref:13593_t:CDS:1 n=1 Tax=Ambispora gerdemannii TaxID=144530 RepID=A0A9N8YL94_9GLOM|nr:13593_t:CDS:10 [Ambispora gerdemannii]
MSLSSFVLGPPPASWTNDANFRSHAHVLPFENLTECIVRKIEPVGRHFLGHARRKLHNHSFTEDQRIQAEKETDKTQDSVLEDSEEETTELLSRDPKDWKDQDHYAVLGLSKYRWRATEEQIKLAHRKKVLKHHPDKKASSGNMNDDAFFKCIQKAHEILSDPVKRRQYDSVDSEIDDSPPSLKIRGDFFEIYGPVFEREARFSNKTPVPLLGDINTNKEELEAFYDFWYKFDSWRSFEYLDKEDADSTDNRDDKRYLEKKNKAERARLKKEDNARLRKIVDNALSSDPRIQKYKKEEKAAKEAKKREKEEAAKRAEEEAKKQLEEKKGKAEQNYFYPNNENPPVDVIDVQLSELEALLENMSVEELQHLKNQLTDAKNKSDAKNILKREAKRLLKSGILAADVIKYFVIEEESTSSEPINEKVDINKQEQIKQENQENKESKEIREWSVEEISLLIKAANKFPGGTLNRWETISEYVAYHARLPPRNNEELIQKSKDVKKGTIALDEEAVRKLQHQKKHADTRITEDPSIREATINYDDPILLATENKSNPSKSKTSKKKSKTRTIDNTSTSTNSSTPTSTDTITKSTYIGNDLIKKNQVTKENGTGSATKPEDLTEITSTPTTNNTSATTWTAEQQAQLERALQAYPPSWKGNGDRWDNITNAVEGKTKKECKLRVKFRELSKLYSIETGHVSIKRIVQLLNDPERYLVEQVKAKKAASGGK